MSFTVTNSLNAQKTLFKINKNDSKYLNKVQIKKAQFLFENDYFIWNEAEMYLRYHEIFSNLSNSDILYENVCKSTRIVFNLIHDVHFAGTGSNAAHLKFFEVLDAWGALSEYLKSNNEFPQPFLEWFADIFKIYQCSDDNGEKIVSIENLLRLFQICGKENRDALNAINLVTFNKKYKLNFDRILYLLRLIIISTELEHYSYNLVPKLQENLLIDTVEKPPEEVLRNYDFETNNIYSNLSDWVTYNANDLKCSNQSNQDTKFTSKQDGESIDAGKGVQACDYKQEQTDYFKFFEKLKLGDISGAFSLGINDKNQPSYSVESLKNDSKKNDTNSEPKSEEKSSKSGNKVKISIVDGSNSQIYKKTENIADNKNAYGSKDPNISLGNVNQIKNCFETKIRENNMRNSQLYDSTVNIISNELDNYNQNLLANDEMNILKQASMDTIFCSPKDLKTSQMKSHKTEDKSKDKIIGFALNNKNHPSFSQKDSIYAKQPYLYRLSGSVNELDMPSNENIPHNSRIHSSYYENDFRMSEFKREFKRSSNDLSKSLSRSINTLNLLSSNSNCLYPDNLNEMNPSKPCKNNTSFSHLDLRQNHLKKMTKPPRDAPEIDNKNFLSRSNEARSLSNLNSNNNSNNHQNRYSFQPNNNLSISNSNKKVMINCNENASSKNVPNLAKAVIIKNEYDECSHSYIKLNNTSQSITSTEINKPKFKRPNRAFNNTGLTLLNDADGSQPSSSTDSSNSIYSNTNQLNDKQQFNLARSETIRDDIRRELLVPNNRSVSMSSSTSSTSSSSSQSQSSDDRLSYQTFDINRKATSISDSVFTSNVENDSKNDLNNFNVILSSSQSSKAVQGQSSASSSTTESSSTSSSASVSCSSSSAFSFNFNSNDSKHDIFCKTKSRDKSSMLPNRKEKIEANIEIDTKASINSITVNSSLPSHSFFNASQQGSSSNSNKGKLLRSLRLNNTSLINNNNKSLKINIEDDDQDFNCTLNKKPTIKLSVRNRNVKPNDFSDLKNYARLNDVSFTNTRKLEPKADRFKLRSSTPKILYDDNLFSSIDSPATCMLASSERYSFMNTNSNTNNNNNNQVLNKFKMPGYQKINKMFDMDLEDGYNIETKSEKFMRNTNDFKMNRNHGASEPVKSIATAITLSSLDTLNDIDSDENQEFNLNECESNNSLNEILDFKRNRLNFSKTTDGYLQNKIIDSNSLSNRNTNSEDQKIKESLNSEMKNLDSLNLNSNSNRINCSHHKNEPNSFRLFHDNDLSYLHNSAAFLTSDQKLITDVIRKIKPYICKCVKKEVRMYFEKQQHRKDPICKNSKQMNGSSLTKIGDF